MTRISSARVTHYVMVRAERRLFFYWNFILEVEFMGVTRKWTIPFLFFLLVIWCVPVTGADLKPNDVIAKHLDSLGPKDTRDAMKSRVVEGKAVYKVLVGGSGQTEGKAILASSGQKVNLLLKIDAYGYRGEQFVSDGSKVAISRTSSDKNRSDFGEFLKGQDAVVMEGLLGGVLTTNWPLLNVEERKAKLDYKGLKNVDGRQLHLLRYRPKKGTDLDISLYFDPETFRHVMTIYKLTIQPGLAASDRGSSQLQESRYKIEERFGDFKTADGLSLPSSYDLRFTEELQNGFSKSLEWIISSERVLNNVQIDPADFQIQ
jgi:hypothetical protein